MINFGTVSFYFWYIVFVVLVYLGVKQRTERKTLVNLDTPITLSGVLLFSKDNTKQIGKITFLPNKSIKLISSSKVIQTVEADEISNLKFNLTASLATSYLLLQLKNGTNVLVFNGVNESELEEKVEVILAESVLTGIGAKTLITNDSGKNIFWTSDEHTQLHVWLRKNNFPGYKARLVPSDVIGFIFIILFPTLIYAGVTIEAIVSHITGDKELGSAIVGYIIIVSITIVSLYRSVQLVRLRKLLRKYKSKL